MARLRNCSVGRVTQGKLSGGGGGGIDLDKNVLHCSPFMFTARNGPHQKNYIKQVFLQNFSSVFAYGGYFNLKRKF